MEGEGDGDGEDENGEDGENEKEGFESLAPEDAAEEEGEELKEDEQQPQVYLRANTTNTYIALVVFRPLVLSSHLEDR